MRYPAGYYVYTGRAKRGLASRVLRHLRKEKMLHWHIDWLTRVAPVQEVWLELRPGCEECACHKRVVAMRGTMTLIPGFGSSDCRCPSHLAFFKRRPRPYHGALRYKEACGGKQVLSATLVKF
ncbi:MAG: DUF123 domain-containing protein [Deltaproteobacteria bacterium]|nr:DUF123 domain-containing protein [Deltaproteobacteria bacterium]